MSEASLEAIVVLTEVLDLDARRAERPEWVAEKAESDLDWMQSQGEKAYGRPIGRDERTLWVAFEDPGSAMTYVTGVQDGLVMESGEMPADEVLEHRLAMARGFVGEDASLDPAAIATLRAIIQGAESADIVLTAEVHELVEPVLFSPAELGSTVEVAEAGLSVETFFLRADRPADATSLRRPKAAPLPDSLGAEAPATKLVTEEATPPQAPTGEVAPADFQAAAEIIKPKPTRPDPGSLQIKRKQPPKPPAEAEPPIRFQRIRIDRAACNAPYASVYLAVRDALRRGQVKITGEEPEAGRIHIKTSWFGKRPVCITRHGLAWVITVDKPGESKVPGKAAKLIDMLCAEPVLFASLPADELEALKDVEPKG